MSRKGRTGAGVWVHPKSANSMAMSVPVPEKPLAGGGLAISVV